MTTGELLKSKSTLTIGTALEFLQNPKNNFSSEIIPKILNVDIQNPISFTIVHNTITIKC